MRSPLPKDSSGRHRPPNHTSRACSCPATFPGNHVDHVLGAETETSPSEDVWDRTSGWPFSIVASSSILNPPLAQQNSCSITLASPSANSRTLKVLLPRATAAVHTLDLVSLVRGTRGGGIQERNVDVVGRPPPAPRRLWPAIRAARNSSRRSVACASTTAGSHLRERLRQLPPVHHPDPVVASAVELGEVEAHRLVVELIDRRRAPLAPVPSSGPGG